MATDNHGLPALAACASRSLTVNPRRRRAGGPKTKTGCQTCRGRRVKCDEARPSCTRCVKSGFSCPGYIAPKPKNNVLRCAPYRPLAPQPSVASATTSQPLNSYREQRYFAAFCEDFLPAVPGYLLNASSWCRMLLQESLKEVSLRHAVTALSALILANEIEYSSIDPSSATSKEARNHRESAMQLYHKTIGGMKRIESHRAALLAHLAMFAFEKLNGRSDLAINYIRGGLNLLRELSTTNFQAGSWSKRARDLTSPVLYIEDDLARIFVSLEIQYIPFGRSQPLLCQKEFYQNISPTRENIPSEGFASIRAARESLERIMARGIDGQCFGTPWRRTVSGPLFEGLGPGLDLQPFVSTDFSSVASIEQCFVEIDSWSAAFKPLSVASDTAKEAEDYMNFISLEIQANTTKILLARTLFSTETEFDSLLSYFQNLVNLCETYISHPRFQRPSPRSSLSTSGVVLPLLLSAVRCRDSTLRHRAVAVLQGLKRMEGVLNSDAIAQLAAWVVNLEEKNGLLKGATIPEEQRVRLSKVKIDFKSRTVEAISERSLLDGGYVKTPFLIRW